MFEEPHVMFFTKGDRCPDQACLDAYLHFSKIADHAYGSTSDETLAWTSDIEKVKFVHVLLDSEDELMMLGMVEFEMPPFVGTVSIDGLASPLVTADLTPANIELFVKAKASKAPLELNTCEELSTIIKKTSDNDALLLFVNHKGEGEESATLADAFPNDTLSKKLKEQSVANYTG